MSYVFPLPDSVGPHNRFDMIHEFVKGDECKLGFEMRVFAQMAAGVAWVDMMSTRGLGISQSGFTCSLL